MFKKRDEDPLPNKFTIAMGKLIQKARSDAGFNQQQLADEVFRTRETISVIENGKTEVGTITLGRIASILRKPIPYFYPLFAKREIVEDDLSLEEEELLLHFRKVWNPEYEKIAINQVKALADLDIQEFTDARRKEFLEDIRNLDKKDPMYRKFKKRGLVD